VGQGMFRTRRRVASGRRPGPAPAVPLPGVAVGLLPAPAAEQDGDAAGRVVHQAHPGAGARTLAGALVPPLAVPLPGVAQRLLFGRPTEEQQPVALAVVSESVPRTGRGARLVIRMADGGDQAT